MTLAVPGLDRRSRVVPFPSCWFNAERTVCGFDDSLTECCIGNSADRRPNSEGNDSTEHDNSLLGAVLRHEVLPKHLVDCVDPRLWDPPHHVICPMLTSPFGNLLH